MSEDNSWEIDKNPRQCYLAIGDRICRVCEAVYTLKVYLDTKSAEDLACRIGQEAPSMFKSNDGLYYGVVTYYDEASQTITVREYFSL